MRTDELISALAADRVKEIDPRWRLAAAMAAGLLVSAVMFFTALGIRRDIDAALGSWRFDLKMAVLVLATGIAVVSSQRAARPVGTMSGSLVWLIPLALLCAVIAELATVQSSAWPARLVGTNAVVCLTAVPALAAAPLAMILLAMRRGAPESPTRAGALAGLAAAATAALLYGLHCFDDSPLFVAAWYPLASLPVVAAGAIAGHRLLRW